MHAEVLGGVQRRRHWTPEEKLRMVEETFLPGNSVSLVARMHGVAPNQLFGWRRQAASGALTATRAGGEVVPASEYRALENQVRELQRMLGKKTMENEILREAISRVAGPKKTPLRTLSLPEGDLCRCRMYSPRKRPVKTVASYGRFRENGREVGMTGGGWEVAGRLSASNARVGHQQGEREHSDW